MTVIKKNILGELSLPFGQDNPENTLYGKFISNTNLLHKPYSLHLFQINVN